MDVKVILWNIIFFFELITASLQHQTNLLEQQIKFNDNKKNSSVNCSDYVLCPSWQYCASDGYCKCGESPHDIIECEGDNSLKILTSFCATYDYRTNTTLLGSCLYNSHRSETLDLVGYYPSNGSQLTEVFCGKFNRQGSLCGSCKDGYFPLAYSYNMTCVKCEETWYNWIEYLLIVYVPLTIFYLVILFFQVNMTSSYWLGFVIFSQAISFPMMCRIVELSYESIMNFKVPLQVGLSVYGFWNLDFFRVINNKTCLRLDFLTITLMDYLSGIYPLFLILMTYFGVKLYDSNFKLIVFLTKPIRALLVKNRTNFKMRTSLIDAFSTFFLLSSMKVWTISCDLLFTATVYTLHSDGRVATSKRLYLNGEKELFGRNHLPYGICAIAGIFISAVYPTLLLGLYPFQFFQKCINVLPSRWQIILRTFVDNHQSSFKNGTNEGTRDFRWFSSFFFIIRLVMFLTYCISLNTMYFVLVSIVLILLSSIITAVQPFKENCRLHFLTPTFLIYLSCFYLCIVGADTIAAKPDNCIVIFCYLAAFVGFSPIVYLLFLVIKKLVCFICNCN